VSLAETQPADLSRRERRKLELRTRMLEAASHLFSEHGFHATKVADICDRADVAHKTFFNHFPSKQHLLREIANHGIDELLVDLEAARKQEQTTPQRLVAFFAVVAERTVEGGPMNRELVTELVHVVHGSPTKSEQARRLHDAFAKIVNDGLAAGDVTRRHDAETLTEMILGAYYVLMLNYANLDDFPIEKQAAAVARFLGDALAPPAED
jgi:AcrR family transcriptional regulator